MQKLQTILIILAAVSFLFLTTAFPKSETSREKVALPKTTSHQNVVASQTTPKKELPIVAEGSVVVNPFGSSSNQTMTFQPNYIKVMIGVNNTVTWVNEDIATHTVTSVDRLFDYFLHPMQKVTYVFHQPGMYRYVCTLHPWMTGIVEVVG